MLNRRDEKYFKNATPLSHSKDVSEDRRKVKINETPKHICKEGEIEFYNDETSQVIISKFGITFLGF